MCVMNAPLALSECLSVFNNVYIDLFENFWNVCEWEVGVCFDKLGFRVYGSGVGMNKYVISRD